MRIPATTLIGAGFKHINRLVTRRQCIELCLSEREFLCKSASYRRTQRNNYNRERERDLAYDDDPTADEEKIALGECILSREDKNSKPDAFRVANDEGEEYMENQCVPQGQQLILRYDAEREVQLTSHSGLMNLITDFVEHQCSYESYLNATFLYGDHVITGVTDLECQERCDAEPRFKCIGVTYRGRNYGRRRDPTATCTLHSDDIISLGPRAVRGGSTGSVYMRRVRCLNGMTTGQLSV